jgi:hypothetical protein
MTLRNAQISLVEIYKVVATLFLKFEVELVNGKESLRSNGQWFNKQEGFEVRVKRRGPGVAI